MPSERLKVYSIRLPEKWPQQIRLEAARLGINITEYLKLVISTGRAALKGK